MKNAKTLTILSVCCCVCLAVATTARADFVRLEVDIKNDIEACQPAGGFDLNLVVCNFYAVFDHPGDKITNTGDPASVTTTDPNGYFQHVFGGDKAPQCALFELYPDLACDSFVTIGRKCSDDPGGDNTGLDPGWDPGEFNNNGHLLGGWYAVPFADGSTQGDAGMYEDLRVLIAQLSVAPGETISGEAFLYIWPDGADSPVEIAVELECSAPDDPIRQNNDCPADLDGDGMVGPADLAILLAAWGPVPTPDPPDFDGDGDVGPFDLATLLANWGPCL